MLPASWMELGVMREQLCSPTCLQAAETGLNKNNNCAGWMGEARKCLFTATKQLMCHCLSWAMFKLLSKPCLSSLIRVYSLYAYVVFSFHLQDQFGGCRTCTKMYGGLRSTNCLVSCSPYPSFTKITGINENLWVSVTPSLMERTPQPGMSPEIKKYRRLNKSIH